METLSTGEAVFKICEKGSFQTHYYLKLKCK